MIINVSKLGRSGTGMWNYSIKYIEAIYQLGQLHGIICPEMHRDLFAKYQCSIITVPDFISNSSQVGKLKPLLWWLYSFIMAIKVSSFRHTLRSKKHGVVVATTHHALPFLSNQVITIHDLRPYYYPDSILQRIYFRFFLPRLAKKACSVVTVSNHVKHNLISLFSLNAEKVNVVYNSVDKEEFESIDSHDSRVILAVGASWAHKNIDSILHHHAVWRDAYVLHVVCAETAYVAGLKRLVKQYNLDGKVVFLHNLPFTHLVNELSKAWCLVYPSIDEGFGIPPLESMASSTPVIVSDIPVFHEVFGNSVLYVNADDASSWRYAFEHLRDEYSYYVSQGHNCVNKYSFELMKSMVFDSIVDKS